MWIVKLLIIILCIPIGLLGIGVAILVTGKSEDDYISWWSLICLTWNFGWLGLSAYLYDKWDRYEDD